VGRHFEEISISQQPAVLTGYAPKRVDMNIDHNNNHASTIASTTTSELQEHAMESDNKEKSIGLFEQQAATTEKQHPEIVQNDPPEPPSEAVQKDESKQEDFSIFTTRQKKLMVMVASLASLFSPMATAIYCQLPIVNLVILVH
jgi:hypothetical protein